MSKELRIPLPILLASGSPRRKELIQFAFSNVTICPSQAQEVLPSDIPCMEAASFLAKLKAEDLAISHPNTPVIGCDTVVILDDKILNKPKDEQDALLMLRALSGREHQVCTGCCIAYQGKTHVFSEVTHVRFWDLTDEQLQSYVDTREPMDKAGAYGIQSLGSLFVRQIKGDYFNVVGLPVSRLYREFINFLPFCVS